MRFSEEDLARRFRENEDLRRENLPDAAKVELTQANTSEADGVVIIRGEVASPNEYEMQRAVMQRAREAALGHSEFDLLYAIPNGQYRRGERPEAGLRSGVPDLFLPVARGGYHGMYIELKVGRNRLAAAQRKWLKALAAQGYYCVVAWDDPNAVINEIRNYLEGNRYG